MCQKFSNFAVDFMPTEFLILAYIKKKLYLCSANCVKRKLLIMNDLTNHLIKAQGRTV